MGRGGTEKTIRKSAKSHRRQRAEDGPAPLVQRFDAPVAKYENFGPDHRANEMSGAVNARHATVRLRVSGWYGVSEPRPGPPYTTPLEKPTTSFLFRKIAGGAGQDSEFFPRYFLEKPKIGFFGFGLSIDTEIRVLGTWSWP